MVHTDPAPPANCAVVYGSQTGTAEAYSSRIATALCGIGIHCSVGSMDDFGWGRLRRCRLAVVVAATTGDGDAPDNMKRCWVEMRTRGCEPAEDLSYAVFCLGDSGYEKYNYVGKMMHNLLSRLGGTPLLHRGLGDDQDPAGLDEGFEPWLGGLLAALEHSRGTPISPAARFVVEARGERKAAADEHAAAEVPATAADRLWTATICSNRRMTPADHFQDVRHVEMKVEAAAPPWEVGGSVGLYPRNPPQEVARLLRRLAKPPGTTVRIEEREGTGITWVSGAPALAGRDITLHTLFSCHLDICGTPGRSAFEILARFSRGDAEQQEKLQGMASNTPVGMEDLRFYCTREKRTFVEVLCDFPSVDIPLEWLLELIPPLRPRLYSVSSAPVPGEANPVLSVTVALVEYKTPYGRPKRGLCSRWVSDVGAGQEIRVVFKPPAVQLPDTAVPVVLVGPGTGIAPCRAVIQARRAAGAGAGNVTLIVGARNRGKDFLYGGEFEELAGDGWLRLHTAFSRDQDSKFYVQHLIRQRVEVRDSVAATLVAGGHLYISGTSKNMPDAVQRAVAYAISQLPAERGGIADEDQAKAYVARMKKERRLQLDCW
eukprot:TRINITY_DN18123_c0_g1_i1.p1 TRINITY_DN18123_c0_g1~~TRINITY_DN18123_c0_g1_i1.p1  ORF type:complete len:628 (+),score=147.46 TRINITY_DN18123_c0_g1_i1:84-1886(+)